MKELSKKMKLVLAIAMLGALFSLGYCAGCDYKSVPYQSNTGRTWTINIYVKQCKYSVFHAPIWSSLPQLQIRPALKILMLHIHVVFIMMMEAVAIHFME